MKICITLCTRGRPVMLARCLESLPAAIAQAGMEVEVTVVVIENGERSGAEARVEGYRNRLDASYLFEPEVGIPMARNRGVEAALDQGADWIVFIDDDEWVAEDWLKHLVAASRSYDAQVLNGPVLRDYDASAPDWLPRYRPGTRSTGMELPSAPTNNTMAAAHLFAANPERQAVRFDTRLRLTGGEDSELFQRVRARGHRIVWVEEAKVFEEYPAGRATLQWHIRRNIRRSSCGVLIERMAGRPLLGYAIRGASRSAAEGIARLLRAIVLMANDRRKARRDFGLGILSLASSYGYLKGLFGFYSAPYAVIDGH